METGIFFVRGGTPTRRNEGRGRNQKVARGMKARVSSYCGRSLGLRRARQWGRARIGAPNTEAFRARRSALRPRMLIGGRTARERSGARQVKKG